MKSDDKPPAKGEFCHRHFSWLCQAGQGKCQRGDDYEPPPFDPLVCDIDQGTEN
jgi:hypothetical protein